MRRMQGHACSDRGTVAGGSGSLRRDHEQRYGSGAGGLLGGVVRALPLSCAGGRAQRTGYGGKSNRPQGRYGGAS